MPAANDAAAARPPSRTTRSSIRSLHFGAISKAFDTKNKSSDAADKSPKKSKDTAKSKDTVKSKDTAAKRVSAMGRLQTTAPATANAADKQPARAGSPVVKKTRPTSAIPKPANSSSDEQPAKPLGRTSPKTALPAPTRTSSLRAKKPAPAATTLPKYQPKTVSLDPIDEPSSPPRKPLRRRLDSSDEEKEDDVMKSDGLVPDSPTDRSTRPISPLPKRAALKVNLTSAINVTPTAPTKKTSKSSTSSSLSKTSLARPTKTVKTTDKATEKAEKRTSLPRPVSTTSSGSSADSSRKSSPASHVSHSSSLRSALGLRQKPSAGHSPLRQALKADSLSPPPTIEKSRSEVSDTSTPLFLEGQSQDRIDAADVEYLLSGMASPNGSTPPLPRLRPRRAEAPSAYPDSRSRTSSQHLMPPIGESPLYPRISSYSNSRNPRESILSWEQVAADASLTLGTSEIENVLYDIPAPFRTGAISPSPSALHIDLPDTPSHSTLPSPGGFASISQVLLPDATPSPTSYHGVNMFDSPVTEGPPPVEGAVVTLLRLQLSSAEKIAEERASLIASLEGQVRTSKETRLREQEEWARQLAVLEQQLQGAMADGDKTVEEKDGHIASLEEQVKHTQVCQDKVLQDALSKAQEKSLKMQEAALKREKAKWEISTVACSAAAEWASVKDVAEGELDLLRSNKETLTVLLAGLAESQRSLSLQLCNI